MADKEQYENVFEDGPPKKGDKLRFGLVLMRHLDRLSNIVVNKGWVSAYNELWRGAEYLASMLNPYWDKTFETDRKAVYTYLKKREKKIGNSRILRNREHPALYSKISNELIKICMRLIRREGLIPEDYNPPEPDSESS